MPEVLDGGTQPAKDKQGKEYPQNTPSTVGGIPGKCCPECGTTMNGPSYSYVCFDKGFLFYKRVEEEYWVCDSKIDTLKCTDCQDKGRDIWRTWYEKCAVCIGRLVCCPTCENKKRKNKKKRELAQLVEQPFYTR